MGKSSGQLYMSLFEDSNGKEYRAALYVAV